MLDFIQQARDLLHQLTSPEYLRAFGPSLYALLAVIIFAETGLFTFFLPGDSLLFVAGVLVGTGDLNIVLLDAVLLVAAIAGVALGYWIGATVGPRLFTRDDSLLFSRKHLEWTKAFYERHGKKTIIIARFVPIARTFAPIVAGIGRMHFPTLMLYNVVGAVAWIVGLTGAGYALGKIEWIRANIDLATIGVALLSLLPGLFEYVRARRARGRAVDAASR